MTFDDLERTLPSGLHDAELLSFGVNYQRSQALVEVNIDVGGPDAPEETYRRARLCFSRLEFVVIDPPDPRYDYREVSMMDAGTGQPNLRATPLPPLSEGTFLCWFFLVGWNSFIQIAAGSVDLTWVDAIDEASPR